MKRIWTLIKPRVLSFRNSGGENGRMRWMLFAGIGALFWAGIFAVTHRVLTYFNGVEGFGDILAFKLLSMVLMTFYSLLLFSAILTSLSKLYLSRDLSLVHGMPVRPETIFLARWIESAVDSSWMVVIYTIPVLLSFGIVFNAGVFFYVNLLFALLPLCIQAAALSALFVMLAVIILPATRIRSIFIFLGLAVLILLYVTFRLLKPERLVDPESFASVVLYLQTMSTPSSPLLPTTWAYDSIRSAIDGRTAGSLFHNTLAWSAAGSLLYLDVAVAHWIYFKGFSKAQAAMIRLFKSNRERIYRWLSFLRGPTRALVVKEFRSFWRDQTQWSQLFLLAALIGIYLYNFSALPLEKSPIKTFYLQNLFSFLNMALAAFVLTAITARFAFPSVSMEGSAFWLIRSAPIRIRTFLWIKFMVYLFPLVLLSEILIVATNLLLQVTPFMMALSVITLLLMSPAVVSLGIGLGAAYPNFTSENPAQSVTGFGGLMFMIYSAAFIGAVCILESGPVYRIFMSGIHHHPITPLQWIWIVAAFTLVLVLCMVTLVVPMRFGARRLEMHHRLPAEDRRADSVTPGAVSAQLQAEED